MFLLRPFQKFLQGLPPGDLAGIPRNFSRDFFSSDLSCDPSQIPAEIIPENSTAIAPEISQRMPSEIP